MSISTALNNALSGLTASSKAAGVVSTNLANVLTDGFARREIELNSQADERGGGVLVAGVNRMSDPGLLNERRMADSDASHADTLAGYAARLETAIGTPDQPSSLSARISELEQSLVSAASRPEEDVRLKDIALRAGDVATSLQSLSGQIQSERTRADTEIGQVVGKMNDLLQRIQSLNTEIAKAGHMGHPTAALQDHRQVAIDELADYVPLRSANRENGTVALYTPGGAILLDGKPAEISFTPTSFIGAHMTLGNGLLSGLEIDGHAITASGTGNQITGGKLSALFEIRDDLAVDAQAQLDATARNLIERFQDPGLDSTRAPGDPGLFTDAGAAFATADEVGIAGRIRLNALVDPKQGGEVWRLRDGLGATTPGPAGNARLLNDLATAMSDQDTLASGILGPTERNLSGHVAALTSYVSQQRLSHEQSLSFASARQAGLIEVEKQQGVDTDAEMQRLLLIEQAYSANARMIQTVDELLQTLLRI